MTPTTPTTEVFAFSAPKIKGAELSIALSLGAGSQHVLRGTLSIWRGLASHLLTQFPEISDARRPGYVPSRRDGRILKPEVRAAYVRAWADWKDGRVPSLAAAARRDGLDYFALQRWCKTNADTLQSEAEALAAKPLFLKPSGKIL